MDEGHRSSQEFQDMEVTATADECAPAGQENKHRPSMRSSGSIGEKFRTGGGYAGDRGPEASSGDQQGEGIHVPGVGDVKWKQLRDFIIGWIKNPLNMALIFWTMLSLVPTVILVLLFLGALNEAIPTPAERRDWILYSNLTLNALFVLMCLVWHPRFFQQTFQVVRWREKDRADLRGDYCRGGVPKPQDRFHIAVILFWFHLCCFSMYALFILWWAYRPGNRPVAAATITVVVSTVAPIIAVLWNIFSPLGRDRHDRYQEPRQGHDLDRQPATEEGQGSEQMGEKSRIFLRSHKPVESPTWQGRLLRDCFEDHRVAACACMCPFCIFGYNTERLGLGQRGVQAFTFLLIVAAPCIIFIIVASAVDDGDVQKALVAIGLFLSFTGLLYGGWWRSRMRKKYGLPASRWCCYNTTLTDCFTWLFFPFCALCQEVRTTDQYDMGDHTFYKKTSERGEAMGQQEGGPDPAIGTGGGGAVPPMDIDADQQRWDAADPRERSQQRMQPMAFEAGRGSGVTAACGDMQMNKKG